MKIIAWFYLISLIGLGFTFLIHLLIEKNLDNCHPLKKWWRRHIVDYDPTEPRPEGTTCDE